MEREVGGGIGMGNTCKPMAVSFQCMTKSTTNKKKKKNFGKKKDILSEDLKILFVILVEIECIKTVNSGETSEKEAAE